MTNRTRKTLTLLIAGGVALSGGGMLAAQAVPQLVSNMADGAWSLKAVGRANAPARSLCMGKQSAPLAQVEHRGKTCRLSVQEIGPRDVAFTYDCGAGNSGYTRVRGETSKLVQIDTQGFKDNMPFHNRYEGRWTGASCQ